MTQALIVAPTMYCFNTGDFAERPEFDFLKTKVANNPDKALLAADRDLAEVRAIFARKDDPALDDAILRMGDLIDTITFTPPQSLAGIAAKLRLLCDEHMGIPARLNPDDITSLRQVLDAVEKMGGAAQ